MLKNVLASLGLVKRAETSGAFNAADRKALHDVLGEFDLVEAGLRATVLQYVLEGENDSILLHLRAATPGTECLKGHLAEEVWIYGGPNGRELDRAATARNAPLIAARRRFLLQCESWDAAAMRRLGQAVDAVNARPQGHQPAGQASAATVPGWFRAVLDSTVNCWRDHRKGRDEQNRLGLLTAARCLEMLALDGIGTEGLVGVCFGLDDYTGRTLGGQVRGAADLPAVLLSDPEGVVTGLRALPPADQAEAVGWVGEAIGLPGPLYEAAVSMLVNGGKQVGAAVLTTLRRCDPARVQHTGATLLTGKTPRERLAGIQILGRIVGAAAEPLLRAQAAAETVRAVDQALKEALTALEAGGAGSADDRPDDETGFQSADGAWIEIPPAEPVPDTPFPPGAAEVLRPAAAEAERLAILRHAELVADEKKRRAEGDKYVYAVQPYKKEFSPAGVDLIVRIAAGLAKPGDRPDAPMATNTLLSGSAYLYTAGAKVFAAALNAVLSRPEVTAVHLARLEFAGIRIPMEAGSADVLARLLLWHGRGTETGRRLKALIEAGLDVRTVLAAGGPWAPAPAAAAAAMLYVPLYGASDEPRNEDFARAMWPLVAEHLKELDPVFGLAPAKKGIDTYHAARALNLLGLLPALPRRFLPGVLDMAMGGQAVLGPAARALLQPVKAATPLLIAMLTSSDAVRRQRAAALVQRMGDAAHIPALRSALEAEKSETVRAALLRALVSLGDDVSDQFSEEKLLAQAKAGLKKNGGKLLDWFPVDALPELSWADGRAVPPEVVRWWLVLADKVKLPGGDPLLRMTLDRLDHAGAARLGTLVLSAFIAQDTRLPTSAEAASFAEAGADALAASYQRWQPGFTREQAFEQLRKQKLGNYLGSANDHRGILALARHAPGVDAVQSVRAFFRDHYQRTAQCKALLECLAAIPDPAALQLLLATANRYRTAGVQKHAAALVDAVAEENGWTRDELADRTVPTGGLDAEGVLELPVGSRSFRVVLDTAAGNFGVTLFGSSGKPLKALPSLPADASAEEKEEMAAAKKAFGSLRKELKQTAQLQNARLYEAMCTGRVWPPEDFEAFLLRHPVVGPLCRRLVFAGLDAEGAIVSTFRPMEDGTLTDAADATVVLDGLAGIRVAHEALLPADTAAAWGTHLADYDVVPLFEQFGRASLDLGTLPADATEVTDRKGWTIETFKLRSIAEKMGYGRSTAEDGGFFTAYVKPFTSLGLAARIEFTGAILPETNAPAALLSLGFVRMAGTTFGYKPVPLKDLPPVLLNEAWCDLHRAADAGTGFDPDWEKKSAW